MSAWSRAYARQALADLNARDRLLAHDDLPRCEELHLLQMACEKLCKAFLIDGGATPDSMRRSHAFVAGPLPIIVRQFCAREAGRLPRDSWIVDACRSLARQIELLAPALDDGGRSPANSEYPWVDASGRVIAPADHRFAIDLLHSRAGTTLLKAVRAVAMELADAPEDE